MIDYRKTAFAEMKCLACVFFVFAAATAVVSCNRGTSTIELEAGQKYRIDIQGKEAYFEVTNGMEETSWGLVRGGEFLVGSYLSGESFELLFRSEDGNRSITIKDSNGDGLPDQRVFKNLETGEVTREVIDYITWKAATDR